MALACRSRSSTIAKPSAEAFGRWVDDHAAANTVVLEIGAGYNTPGVVRVPGERLTEHFSKWRMIRVNPEFADVPAELGARALSLPIGAAEAIEALQTNT